jgi:hypothetical protein
MIRYLNLPKPNLAIKVRGDSQTSYLQWFNEMYVDADASKAWKWKGGSPEVSQHAVDRKQSPLTQCRWSRFPRIRPFGGLGPSWSRHSGK